MSEYIARHYLMRTKSKLPSGWNKKQFNSRLSFEARLQYAIKRAKSIGDGSSRTVFEIKEGRKLTAMKVASSRAGVAQNKIETNPKIHLLYKRVVVPLIGYDKSSRNPIWTQFEKVKPLKKSIFRKVTGFYFVEFTDAVYHTVHETMFKKKKAGTSTPVKRMEKIRNSNSKFFQAVVDMTLEFGLEPVDYQSEDNWGIYKGKPVIIDFGYTQSIVEKFYKHCL